MDGATNSPLLSLIWPGGWAIWCLWPALGGGFRHAESGISEVVIPFSDLKPVVRAKPVGLPLRFEAAKVSRLQILHSRFADDGESNPGFRAGPLRLQVLSIEAFADGQPLVACQRRILKAVSC